MRNDSTPPHDRHRAPQGDYNDEEWAALQAQIAQSPEEPHTAQALRRVDALLRSAPMLAPPAEFFEKVMHALATMPRAEWERRDLSVGVVLGLMLAAFLSVPLLAAVLFALVSTLADVGIFSTLLQTGVSVFSGVMRLLRDVAELMQTLVTASTWNAVLAALTLPAAALWGRVLWRMLGVPQWPTRGPRP